MGFETIAKSVIVRHETDQKARIFLNVEEDTPGMHLIVGYPQLLLDGRRANLEVGGVERRLPYVPPDPPKVVPGLGGTITVRNKWGNTAIVSSVSDDAGLLEVHDSSGTGTIHLEGQTGIITLRPNGKEQLRLQGSNIFAGGNGHDGDLLLFASTGDNKTLNQATIHLDGETGDITQRSNGKSLLRLESGNIWAGGNGGDGDLLLFASTGDNKTADRATIHLDGEHGSARFGGSGSEGDVQVFRPKAKNSDFKQSSVALIGRDEVGGIVRVRNGKDIEVVTISTESGGGVIGVRDAFGSMSVTIDGPNGDITLANADCAEEFDIASDAGIAPGSVMVAVEGGLIPCEAPCDRRVVGVVSGAGQYRPAIVLDRRATATRRLPIALIGKVYCLADASYGNIDHGDLLTTSPTSGHAMKAPDAIQAFGAVLGKALGKLSTGRGHIPVLVTLQ